MWRIHVAIRSSNWGLGSGIQGYGVGGDIGVIGGSLLRIVLVTPFVDIWLTLLDWRHRRCSLLVFAHISSYITRPGSCPKRLHYDADVWNWGFYKYWCVCVCVWEDDPFFLEWKRRRLLTLISPLTHPREGGWNHGLRNTVAKYIHLVPLLSTKDLNEDFIRRRMLIKGEEVRGSASRICDATVAAPPSSNSRCLSLTFSHFPHIFFCRRPVNAVLLLPWTLCLQRHWVFFHLTS